jgi:hypothetical protein
MMYISSIVKITFPIKFWEKPITMADDLAVGSEVKMAD